MGEYASTVKPYETDIFGYCPPSMLIRYALGASTRQAHADNLTDESLYRELGAVWMLARLSFWQERPVSAGAKLQISVGPQHRDGAAFLRAMDISENGENAARVWVSFIAVTCADRKIVRPSALKALWPDAPSETGKSNKRLKLPADMPEYGDVFIRYSDCDFNGHLNSAKYADIICDASGYWSDKPRIFSKLQIDYSAEVKPGAVIRLYEASGGESGFIRGECDGAICFSSAYSIRQ